MNFEQTKQFTNFTIFSSIYLTYLPKSHNQKKNSLYKMCTHTNKNNRVIQKQKINLRILSPNKLEVEILKTLLVPDLKTKHFSHYSHFHCLKIILPT